MGTIGAPCPPNATSSALKSLTTGSPVTAAIAAPSPNCAVILFSGK